MTCNEELGSASDEFLTDAQLCGLLHLDPRTTLRWRADGGGPAFIRAGSRRVLYRRRTGGAGTRSLLAAPAAYSFRFACSSIVATGMGS